MASPRCRSRSNGRPSLARRPQSVALVAPPGTVAAAAVAAVGTLVADAAAVVAAALPAAAAAAAVDALPGAS